MNKKTTMHFCDANSILVVNPSGKIRKLYTPFRVKCIESTGNIKEGTTVHVEEVYNTKADELIFMVQGASLSFKHFHIDIKF